MDAGIKNELLNHMLSRIYSVQRNILGDKIKVDFHEFKEVQDKVALEGLVSYDAPPKKSLGDSLKVASWNIATGDEFDGVQEYLKDVDADIIFLQEVGINCPPDHRNVFLDLAESLGYSGVFGRSMAFVTPDRKPLVHDGRPAVIGETILTKLPIDTKNAVVLDLPPYFDWTKLHANPENLINSSRAGNRMGIVSTIMGENGQNLLVSSAHLEDKCFYWEKAHQAKYLLREMEKFGISSQIIGGDINSFAGKIAPVYRAFLNRGFSEANRNESTVRGMPWFRLDNIFAKGNYSFRKVSVDSSQTCSDHYPTIATLKR